MREVRVYREARGGVYSTEEMTSGRILSSEGLSVY